MSCDQEKNSGAVCFIAISKQVFAVKYNFLQESHSVPVVQWAVSAACKECDISGSLMCFPP